MRSTAKRRALLLSSVCAASLLGLKFSAAPDPFAALRASGEREGVALTRGVVGETRAATQSSTAKVLDERRAADEELSRAITRVIAEGELASARLGISVVSLRDGRVLHARDADRLFTPASNMKLYTTAAALDILGADYRWRTSVYARSQPDTRGALAGDIVLYGRGAPDLTAQPRRRRPGASSSSSTTHLTRLADELYRRGVRRISGSVIGDESYFRGEALGDGWLWEDVQWYFGAEPSALSVDGNEVTLTISAAARVNAPAELKLVPPTDYMRLTNDTTTAERGVRSAIGVHRGLSTNEVRVWGEFPIGSRGYDVRLSVYKPALRAAQLFREALRARGITVEGEAHARDWRARREDEFDPARAVELAATTSRPLADLIRAINKQSLNLEAELLLRTLGKERGATMAPVPDPEKMPVRADDVAGVAVIRQWLGEAGVPTGTLSLHDGSGLSRLNLVTPEATTRLLALMAGRPEAKVFHDSLPIAGRDGTLSFRLRGASVAGQPRVAAKTGSLTYVDSLSGYATTAAGEPLAFSIFCNDDTTRAASSRVIDAIVALLVAYPGTRDKLKSKN